MVKAQKQIKTDGSTIITNRDLFTEKLSIDDLKDLINAHIHIEGCYLEKTKYRNTYILKGEHIAEEIYIVIASMNGGGAKANKKFVIPYSSRKFRELLLNHRVEIFGVFPTISDDGNVKFALCRVSDAQIRRSSIYQEMLEGKTNLNSSSRWFNFNDLYNALINNTTIKVNGETKIIPFSSLDDFILEEYCKDISLIEEFNKTIENGYKSAIINKTKPERVIGIHQLVAEYLRKNLPDNYEIISATTESNKELSIEGFYRKFNADIGICRNGIPIGCSFVKLVGSNFLQNCTGYVDQLRGQIANLKRNGVHSYNLFVSPINIPYFRESGILNHIETFGLTALEHILSLDLHKGEEYVEQPNSNCLYLFTLNNLDYLKDNLKEKIKSEEHIGEYLNSINVSQVNHYNLEYLTKEQKEYLDYLTDINRFINEIISNIKSRFPADFEEVEVLAIA